MIFLKFKGRSLHRISKKTPQEWWGHVLALLSKSKIGWGVTWDALILKLYMYIQV